MARCPECDATIDLEEEALEEGEYVGCPECGVGLEVTQVGPLQLEIGEEQVEEAAYGGGIGNTDDDEWN